jgi:hypothetical protein
MTQRHPCTLLGFVASLKLTKLKIVRVYSPFASLQEFVQTARSWWVATTKSIEWYTVCSPLWNALPEFETRFICSMRTLLEIDQNRTIAQSGTQVLKV